MATISVDPDVMLDRVKKMEDLLAEIAENESMSVQRVGDLGEEWQGQDYTLFLAHYASTVTENSTYMQLYQIISNYLGYVRTAAYMYSQAISAAEAEAAAIGTENFSTKSTEAQTVLSGIITAVTS